MIRHKVSYFLSIAVVLVLLFFFPKPILLAVLFLEIALPLLALVLLRMDIAAMTLSLQAPVTSNVNAPLALDITYKAKRPLFSVSAVEMTLEMQNLLFHTQEERWLRIGLSLRRICAANGLSGHLVCSAWTSLGSVPPQYPASCSAVLR